MDSSIVAAIVSGIFSIVVALIAFLGVKIKIKSDAKARDDNNKDIKNLVESEIKTCITNETNNIKDELSNVQYSMDEIKIIQRLQKDRLDFSLWLASYINWDTDKKGKVKFEDIKVIHDEYVLYKETEDPITGKKANGSVDNAWDGILEKAKELGAFDDEDNPLIGTAYETWRNDLNINLVNNLK